jgi:FtsH-binding integral membrane protein
MRREDPLDGRGRPHYNVAVNRFFSVSRESAIMTSDTPISTQAAGDAPTTTQDPIGRAINQGLDSFRARLLNLRTMPWSLRIVVTLTFIAISTLGVALALRDMLPGFQDVMPFALGDGTTASRDVVLQTPMFVAALVALGLAWALLLTGAIHSHWYVRFPALLVFSFFAFVEAGVGLPLGPAAAARLTGGESVALLIQLGVFALVWLDAILVGVIQWRAAGRGEQPRAGLAGVTFLLMALALAAHYWFAWSAASEAGQADLFSGLLGVEATLLFFPLVPIIFITGSDIAEIGVSLSDGATRLLRLNRLPWLLALANVVAGGAVLVWSILLAFSESGTPFDPLNLAHGVTAVALGAIFLGFGCLFALVGWGVFALVRRVGRLEAAQRTTPPFIAYLLATLVFYVGFGLSVALVGGLRAPEGVVIIIPLLGVSVGLALLAAQRNRPGVYSLAGLLIALTASIGFFALVNQASGSEGTLVVVALGTLAVVLWLLVRLRINERSAPLLRQLLMLNIGLLVIAGVLAFFDRSRTSGVRISGVTALIFVGAFVWDLITSGKATNVSGRRFPRHIRVYLYLGYTLLLTTLTVLFAAVSFNNADTANLYGEAVNQQLYGRYGLLTLGVATLFATFILRMSRASASSRPSSAPAAPPPVLSPPPYMPYPPNPPFSAQQPYPAPSAYPPAYSPPPSGGYGPPPRQ